MKILCFEINIKIVDFSPYVKYGRKKLKITKKELKNLLETKGYIHSIKEVRVAARKNKLDICGLKESKEIVDNLIKNHNWDIKDIF